MHNNQSVIQFKTMNVSAERSVNSQTPEAMNNRLEALKVLVTSILSEVESLERGSETRTAGKLDLLMEVQRFETDLIRCALTRTGGRQRRAAALLGIKPTTLHAKLKRYGLINAEINEPDEVIN